MRRVDSLEKTDAGRDWGQEEKGMTEDEMAGWLCDPMDCSTPGFCVHYQFPEIAQTHVHKVGGFFQESCMDIRVGLQRKLSSEELMFFNCGVGEDS